jgi:hypothetical protein
MEKFKNVETDSDTKIHLEKYLTIGVYDAKFEYWSFEGISGMSLIFLNDDLMNLSEVEIVDIIKNDIEIGRYTYRKGDEYTFINYNFKVNN